MTTDIFFDTLAEMTWYEVDQAAKDGAVLLWGIGVIEQHGPHLPTGTDVYVPQAHLREIKKRLAERGVQALIVPPFYWGVNVTSSAFPSSYNVRPEIIKEMMADLFKSFEADGFKRVFCISGHGDGLHNKTIHEGIQLGANRTSLDISFVTEAALAQRIGVALDDPNLTLPLEDPPAVDMRHYQWDPAIPVVDGIPTETPKYVDRHAGRWETSVMIAACERLVRTEVLPSMQATNVDKEHQAIWRKGGDHARKVTPLGYMGDPAGATLEEGVRCINETAETFASAIVARINGDKK